MNTPRRPAGEEAMEQLIAEIGEEAFGNLARRFGGTVVYVPLSIGERHPLHVVLGSDAAANIARAFGGERIFIPMRPHRHARVRDLHRRGALTIAGIATETGYSERHIYRLLSEGLLGSDNPLPSADPQPDLFDN